MNWNFSPARRIRELPAHLAELSSYLRDLSSRVRASVAEAIGDTVSRVIKDNLHRLLQRQPEPERPQPARYDSSHWRDEDWNDDHWRVDEDLPEPMATQRQHPTSAAPSASLGLTAMCMRAAGWWLQRSGSWLGALGVGLGVGALALVGGPLALALGLQRMAARNALVRKLPSVETLGSVTVICSDKTGTLTRNEMTVREILAGGDLYRVTGSGYAPHGQFFKGDGPESALVDPLSIDDLTLFLRTAARCNHAAIRPRSDRPDDWELVGDPTEGALLVAAMKGGHAADDPAEPIVNEIPFDSERKMMSVVVRRSEGGRRIYTKGAPEVLLTRCVSERRAGKDEQLSDGRRSELAEAAATMASRALRVLALAYRDLPSDVAQEGEEQDLVIIGLAGMMDPPRDEVREAVRRCHEAGIRPVMITGDHPATAFAVARELGMARPDEDVITGRDLDQLTDAELAMRVDRVAVYARVTAEHKLRVVHAWQARGEVVAMTGDGVNDAPAIKAADIGIAMGASGTDVAREAADLVLTDDNFTSIVNAVELGRGIYDNIQKFLHYLLAGNTGLVLFVLVVALLGWPFPLTTIQILWMNLVTNGLPALALGVEPPEPDLMRRRPRPPREPIITFRRGLRMLVDGVLVAGVTLLGFVLVYQGEDANLPRARTFVFCLISYAFIFYSFACRSQRYTMPQLGLLSNAFLLAAIVVSGLLQLSVVTLPFARPFFETSAHAMWEWPLLLALALAPVTVIEVAKIIRARIGRNTVKEIDYAT